MEKPLPDKQFKKKVRQEIIIGGIVILFGVVGAYLNGCFAKDSGNETNQTATNTNSDSISNTIQNTGVEIKDDQINAGRDATVIEKNKIEIIENKVEVKGNAFFDSSKQFNYYQGLKQRHIDLPLLQKILDSIPIKNN